MSLVALLRRLLTAEERTDCKVIAAAAVYVLTCVALGTWLAHVAGVIGRG